jgi:hypothetical protein
MKLNLGNDFKNHPTAWLRLENPQRPFFHLLGPGGGPLVGRHGGASSHRWAGLERKAGCEFSLPFRAVNSLKARRGQGAVLTELNILLPVIR